MFVRTIATVYLRNNNDIQISYTDRSSEEKITKVFNDFGDNKPHGLDFEVVELQEHSDNMCLVLQDTYCGKICLQFQISGEVSYLFFVKKIKRSLNKK